MIATSGQESAYANSYDKVARALRQAMIQQAGEDTGTQRQILQAVFDRIDGNGSGVLTSHEMMAFLQSPELGLLEAAEEANCEKFIQLLLEQIDTDRDGTVSLRELKDFLWPAAGASKPDSGRHEPGVIIDLSRNALLRVLGSAAAQGSDEAILEGLASMSKMAWKKGKQIEVRIAKKALQNLFIPQFQRMLNDEEVDVLLQLFDRNGDGVVSAREFVTWLVPQTVQDDKAMLAAELRRIVMEKFGGDVRAVFESFKSYGADCIYKADFITNLKALDSGFRSNAAQDIANILCGHEKGISFGRLSDFVGIVEAIRQPISEPEREPDQLVEAEALAPCVDDSAVSNEPLSQLVHDVPPDSVEESYCQVDDIPAGFERPAVPPIELAPSPMLAPQPELVSPQLIRPASYGDRFPRKSPSDGFNDMSPSSSFHGSPRSPRMDERSDDGNSVNLTPQQRIISMGNNSGSVSQLKRTPSNASNYSTRSSVQSVSTVSVSSYAASYDKVAQTLRDILLQRAGGGFATHKEILQNVMEIIDENGSGVLTSDELTAYLTSNELGLFDGVEDANTNKFCQLLLEQIDVNRDGTIGVDELEVFLWPTSPTKGNSSRHEAGIVIDLSRKALLHALGGAATRGDDAVLEGFAKMSKAMWKKGGKQIEIRIARKALQHLHIPEFHRALNDDEVEVLLHSIDTNGDGVVSAREFVTWLVPQTVQDDKAMLAAELRRIVMEKFGGDVRAMFESFKSYGADCIYKADFITNLKALDPSLTRNVVQDIASSLCGGHEKSITFGRLSDFLGVMGLARLGMSKVRSIDSMDDRYTVMSTERGDEEVDVHLLEDMNELTNMGTLQLSPQASSVQGSSKSPWSKVPSTSAATAAPAGSTLTEEERAEARKLLSESRAQVKLDRLMQKSVELQRSSVASSALGQSARSHATDAMGVSHGAAGLTASQLVEIGYLKHTGRWRGFPYDCWTCCNTADFVCPNNLKYLSPKRSSPSDAFLSAAKITARRPQSSSSRTLTSDEQQLLSSGRVKFKVKTPPKAPSPREAPAPPAVSVNQSSRPPSRNRTSGIAATRYSVKPAFSSHEPALLSKPTKVDQAVQIDGSPIGEALQKEEVNHSILFSAATAAVADREQIEQMMSSMVHAASSSYNTALQSLRDELNSVRLASSRSEQALQATIRGYERKHQRLLVETAKAKVLAKRSSSEPPLVRSVAVSASASTARPAVRRMSFEGRAAPPSVPPPPPVDNRIPWIPSSCHANGKFNRSQSLLPHAARRPSPRKPIQQLPPPPPPPQKSKPAVQLPLNKPKPKPKGKQQMAHSRQGLSPPAKVTVVKHKASPAEPLSPAVWNDATSPYSSQYTSFQHLEEKEEELSGYGDRHDDYREPLEEKRTFFVPAAPEESNDDWWQRVMARKQAAEQTAFLQAQAALQQRGQIM